MEKFQEVITRLTEAFNISAFDSVAWDEAGVALVVLLIVLAFRRFVVTAIVRGALYLASKTPTDVDYNVIKALDAPIKLVVLVLGLQISSMFLTLTPDADDGMTNFTQAGLTFTLFWGLFRIVDPLSAVLLKLESRLGAGLAQDIQQFFTQGTKLILAALGTIAVLQQLGINVGAFLGGLGIAGAAVALAAKDSVANIFGGLMIFGDRMFRVGDWIEAGNLEGTVEEIGLRATRIRTFSKALVTINNAELTNHAVTNWSRMTHRRIKMTLGLEYRTTAAQMQNITHRIRKFLEDDPKVAPKGDVVQLVHFVNYGGSSIDMQLYYFTKTTSWEEWLNIRHQHIIDFKRIVEEEGASFAFPSQSLYFETAIPQSEE